jgi:hypothetical protein
MASGTVLFSVERGLAWITFTRPKNGEAFCPGADLRPQEPR